MADRIEVTYHRPGETAENLQVGDFLLTYGTHRNAKIIQFGQGWEHGFNNPVRYVNHAVLCLGGSELAESLADGVVETDISSYHNSNYAIVRTNLNEHDQKQILDYSYSVLTEKYGYGWLQIGSIAFSMLTGFKIFFGVSETEICSGFVAGALRSGGFIWPKPSTHMTPADLALCFDVDISELI